MTEAALWQRYIDTRLFWQDRTAKAEAQMVEAFSAWAIVYLEEPAAAHEETERFRQGLVRARVLVS